MPFSDKISLLPKMRPKCLCGQSFWGKVFLKVEITILIRPIKKINLFLVPPHGYFEFLHLKLYHINHISYSFPGAKIGPGLLYIRMVVISAVVDTTFVDIYVDTKNIPTCRYNIQHIDKRKMENKMSIIM